MIEKIKLKTRYHFKQTQIPVNIMSTEDVENKIKQKIIPVILELEAKGLIDGFYFIMHQHIDFRLSCDSWKEKENTIKEILKKNKISDELKDHGGIRDDDFHTIDDNSLEFNSRLMMAYLMLKEECKTDDHKKVLKNFPHLWIHYMYNQFGYSNFYEAQNYFNHGFFQLSQALKHNQCNSLTCIMILEQFKALAEKYINEAKETNKGMKYENNRKV